MTLARETDTAPGVQYSVEKAMPVAGARAVPTSCTVVAPFEATRDLLTDRPLRRPSRTLPIETLEDLADLEAIRSRRDEPGIPWEQVKRELGL